MEKIKSENSEKNENSENKNVEIIEPLVTKKTTSNVQNIIRAPEKIPTGYIKDSQGRLRKIV
jgi:hypothetical protein